MFQQGETAQQGVLITFEGVDGCGKSTQCALLAEHLKASGRDVISVREPGGTAISERIRSLVLDPAYQGMSDECELLLYEASRAQLVREVIEPALTRGAWVVCDRFYDSTVAYQAYARALDISLVMCANALGSCGVVPRCTIVLDLAVETALARVHTGIVDRLEKAGRAFQEKVRAGYHALADAEPERVHVVSADGTPDEVFARVVAVVNRIDLKVR